VPLEDLLVELDAMRGLPVELEVVTFADVDSEPLFVRGILEESPPPKATHGARYAVRRHDRLVPVALNEKQLVWGRCVPGWVEALSPEHKVTVNRISLVKARELL
jgi:hypothetical protein